ncbi:MAG: N-acetylmuramoyl-L-alanine amidase [Syntrophomonas sp.]|nr:N-acetylmuramoyl-L-alanine amidase [Syntrophomonas sp.]
MQIHTVPSPNYSQGRNGKGVIAIVNHITAGLMPGTLSWLRNPGAKVSCHYLVAKDGRIYQLVADEDTAWHAGIVKKPDWVLYDGSNPNLYTIGIEHECKSGGELTETQYQATLWLQRNLIRKWPAIKADADHIIGHYRIDSVNRANDPGANFPWIRLFRDLNDVNPAQQTINIRMRGQNMTGIVINNTTYAPVRQLAENLGYKVTWDEKNNTVIVV